MDLSEAAIAQIRLLMAPLATKDDLNVINIAVEELKKENKELRNEIRKLKENEIERSKQLEYMEERQRSNKLIVRGLPLSNDPPIVAANKLLNDKMRIKNTDYKINSAFSIGRATNKTQPIIIEFASAGDVGLVFRQIQILKNSGITIERDRSKLAREKRRYLGKVLYELKKRNNTIRIQLKGTKLYIGNNFFTWERETGLMFKNDIGLEQLHALVKFDCTDIMKQIMEESQ